MNTSKSRNEIKELLKSKILYLLSQIDGHIIDNKSQVLNKEECPLDYPERLAKEFLDYLKSLYIELNGPEAPLEKLTDSQLKFLEFGVHFKADSELAYQDAVRRTIWERITNSNHEDINNYVHAQHRYAEYLLRALAKDFLEDVVGDDSFLLWD